MSEYQHREVSVSITLTSEQFTNSVFKAWTDKVYEPEMRNKDGLRWIRHRFPIKGGISHAEVMRRDLMRPNKMFEALEFKGK